MSENDRTMMERIDGGLTRLRPLLASPRTWVLALGGAAALLFASRASAQTPRPAPATRAQPASEQPELVIVEIRRPGGRTAPVAIGDVVPVEVVVRNMGGGVAVVQAATAGTPGAEVVRTGPRATISPGAEVVLALDVDVRENRVRDGRYESSVFLLDATDESVSALRRVFRDRSAADNQVLLVIPVRR